MKDAFQSEGMPPAARARPVENNWGVEVMVIVWLERGDSARVTVHEYLKRKEG